MTKLLGLVAFDSKMLSVLNLLPVLSNFPLIQKIGLVNDTGKLIL
jgi:hypothetical protein